MTKLAVTFCTAGNRSVEGGSMPVPRMAGAVSEILEVASASVTTGGASPSASAATGFASVAAIDGNVWVTAGSAPVAVPGQAGFPVLAGQTRDFAVAPGDKIAAISL